MLVSFFAYKDYGEDYQESDSTLQKLFKFRSNLAKQGDVESIEKLGLMYERGDGVARDLERAEELYQQAIKLGSKDASELLYRLNDSLSSDKDSNFEELDSPIPDSNFSRETVELEKQKTLKIKLQQAQVDANKARVELKKLRQTEQAILDRQKKMVEEAEYIKLTKERIAYDQAKAESGRQEMELANKKRQEKLNKQFEIAKQQQLEINIQLELQRQQLEIDKQIKLEEQQQELTQIDLETEMSEKEKSKKNTFSSNPCNTSVAKFMSTCID